MMKTTIVLFLACGVLSASAGLSKLDALAMIESGNDDAAVGQAGEVSRYQIKPRIWRLYTPSCSWHDASTSRWVAQQYLTHLEDLFRSRTGREATDFDLYVLWNAGPSYYARRHFSAHHVGPTVRERASRYVNLRTMRNGPRPQLRAAAAAPPPSTIPPVSTPPPHSGLAQALTR